MAKASARRVEARFRRCPACGHRLDPESPTRCALCNFEFRDDRVTGDDVTPYARAFAREEPGWRRMVEWVWFAGGGRLNHLALMRASAASRRFAMVNLLLLSACLGLYQTTRVGWRSEFTSSGVAIKPAGQGWLRLVTAPDPSRTDAATRRQTTLWWSPAQAVIVFVTAGLLGLICLLAMMLILRTGMTAAHSAPYRGEQRMTAAVHYGTAWAAPVLMGGVIIAFKPVSYVADLHDWALVPPVEGFNLSAVVVVAFGLVMWWFWLIRLGATAPARTRSRVVAFFMLGSPTLVLMAAASWWFALDGLYPRLFTALDLSF